MRAALVPSRAFDDASAWTAQAGETRTAEFAGRRVGALALQPGQARYSMGLRADAPAPSACGDYRGLLCLRRLAPGRFEWQVRDELAVGSVRGSDLAAVLTLLLQAAQTLPPAEARARSLEALPRAAAAFGRLFTIDEMAFVRSPDGATAVTLAVRLQPEGIERDFPQYARFIRSNVAPVSFKAEASAPDGPRWWRAEGANRRVTLWFRTHGGVLAPLDAAPRRIPDRLRLRVDYTLKPGFFGVALRDLVGELDLVRSDRELGVRTRFQRPPHWRLPFIIEPFLRPSLRFPFEGPGVSLAFGLHDREDGPTVLTREYRLAIRESWIVRWLGGFTGSAVFEFRRGAEAEAERFSAECLEALRADVLALLAVPATGSGTRVLQPEIRVSRPGRQRELPAPPAGEAPGQGPHAADTAPPEEERHPGTGRLVRSGAEQDDLALARDLVVPLLQLLRGHVDGPGDGPGIGLEVHGMAQVHDHEVLARVDPALELLGVDARDAQVAEEPEPLEIFPGEPGEKAASQEERQPAP